MVNSPYISRMPAATGSPIKRVNRMPNRMTSPDTPKMASLSEKEKILHEIKRERQRLTEGHEHLSKSKNKYLVKQHHDVIQLSREVKRELLHLEKNSYHMNEEQLKDAKLDIIRSLGIEMAGKLFGFGEVLEFMMTEYEHIIDALKENINSSISKDDVNETIHRLQDETNVHLDLLTRNVYRSESDTLEQNEKLSREYEKLYENGRLFSLLNTSKLLKAKKSDILAKIAMEKNTIRELQEGLLLSRKNFSKLKHLVDLHKDRQEETKKMMGAYQENMHRINELSALIVPDDYHTQKAHHKSLVELSTLLDNRLKSENEISRRNQLSVLKLADQIQSDLDVDSLIHDFQENLERVQTPRPNWDNMKPIMDDVETRTLLSNKCSFPDMDVKASSVTIVSKLRDYVLASLELLEDQQKEMEAYEATIELMDVQESQFPKNEVNFFTGLGETSDVPKHLRYTGELKNKKLSKRDLENTLEDIWRQRGKQRKGKDITKKNHFSDFFESYLSTQFSNVVHIKREWSYSIVEGCKLYRDDPDCDMFLAVLDGDVSEDTYNAQFSLLQRLQQALSRLDIKINHMRSGVLKKSVLFKRLNKFFPTKTQKRLIHIKCMLHRQNPKPMVHYHRLFEEDRNHSQGIFVETVREQFLKETQEYNNLLNDMLYHYSDEEGYVGLEDIKQAFFEVDPLKPETEILHHIQMAIDGQMIEEDARFECESFIKNLHFHRIGCRTNPDRVDRIKEQIRRKQAHEAPVFSRLPSENSIPAVDTSNPDMAAVVEDNVEDNIEVEENVEEDQDSSSSRDLNPPTLSLMASSSPNLLVPKLDFSRSKSSNHLLNEESSQEKRNAVKRQLLRDQYNLEQQLQQLSSRDPEAMLIFSPASPSSASSILSPIKTPIEENEVAQDSDSSSSSSSSSSSTSIASNVSIDSDLSVSSISPSELPSYKRLQSGKPKKKRRKKKRLSRPPSTFSKVARLPLTARRLKVISARSSAAQRSSRLSARSQLK